MFGECKMLIIYDFDGTLTPYGIPKYDILTNNGYDDHKLTTEAIELMNKEKISLYEAFYKILIGLYKSTGTQMTTKNVLSGANNVEFNRGVIDYFRDFSNPHNGIKNFIVTCRIEEYVRNTIISPFIEEIHGVKFNIENGIYKNIEYMLDDNEKVNVIKSIIIKYPNTQFIYIGDGVTDKAAFQFTKKNGGISIFVGSNEKDKEAFSKLHNCNIVDYYFSKDYSDNSELRDFIEKKLRRINQLDNEK